jgi:hypothetical protein
VIEATAYFILHEVQWNLEEALQVHCFNMHLSYASFVPVSSVVDATLSNNKNFLLLRASIVKLTYMSPCQSDECFIPSLFSRNSAMWPWVPELAASLSS